MFIESKFNEAPVVVIGAGPTGLATAIQLARNNVPHRLLERDTAPFTGSRGKGLQPRTLEIFDDLGIVDRFLGHGGQYPEIKMHLPDGGERVHRADEVHPPTPSAPYPNSLMVPQWRTGRLLAERLAELGGKVEYGVGVTALCQDPDGVHLTLSTGETITAAYVVGADGGRSTVRKALGVGFEGETREGERMLIADVRLTGLDRDYWHMWTGPDRQPVLSLCPLAGTDDFQLYGPPIEGEITLEALQALAPDGVELTAVGWTSVYRPNIRMVDSYRVGRVFLAGDAAHVHSPAGGQGLNTGIQDGYNLGWKLAVGAEELLDTYEEERLPVAAEVLGISTRLHHRRLSEPLRRDDPALRQLSLHYRGGTLADERRAAPGEVRAGDRAPDAPLAQGRIFDALRGPHATVLAFGAPGAELPPASDRLRIVHLGQSEAQAFTAYDIEEPTILLVRPDGYVGCATPATDPAPIAAYLRRIGVLAA